MMFAVLLLIAGNVLTVLPNHIHAEDNTEVTQNADATCPAPVALVNGSFEQGAAKGTAVGTNGLYFKESEMPPWKTTDDSQGEKVVEVWNYAEKNPSFIQSYPAPPDGNRWAELNAFEPSLLYQDVKTTPGQTIYWRLSHMGRSGVDTMQLRIGAVTANPYDAPVQRQMSDGNTKWGTYTGTYTVPAGQTVTRFGFEAVSSAGGITANGNFLDDIFLGTEPCVTAKKTVSPQGDVHAGDELTYSVQVKNEGGDIASDAGFTDLIPEGTEYVPGSLKLINGSTAKNLTDASDGDEGYFDGSKVHVKMGNLPNTTDLPNGVTVQFKVKTLTDYSVKEIHNKAQINYDNLLANKEENTESNEVTTPITFNEPKLESKKTSSILQKANGNTDADHPEVGDTLQYTIQTRNTSGDSIAKNLTISDALPEGLEYVPGTLKVDGKAASDAQDDDKGYYAGGKAAGQFGNVSDTEWHNVTFQAKVKSGQSGKDIVNTASVTGDNINDPDKPNNEVKVYPRNPELESKKTSLIQEKAEGNKDADHPEVGDKLQYTIQTRNISEDSLVKKLTISDAIPAGLEYVPGTLKVDGTAVTDAQGDDQGDFNDGKVNGQFGDITDMEWHNVTFEVKVQPGQAGKDIVNTATVGGDNVDKPNTPNNEVKVYPRNPVLESEKTAENLDSNKDKFEVGDTAVYTIKTRNKITESTIENLSISDELPAGLTYVDGSLKASNGGEAAIKDGKVTANFGDVTDTEWRTVTFQAKIESGYIGKTIKNVAEVDGGNIDNPDKPGTDIKVDPKDPKLESKKTASIQEKAEGNKDADHPEVGDTLLYTIQTRNTIEDSLVKNLIISDAVPEGLEYVSGTMKVDGAAVTDAKDEDQGQYADGKLAGQFNDVTDTKWHNVTFEVKVKAGQAGKDIVNTANISGDNVGDPDKPSHEVKVYPRDPVLESEKTAKNLDSDKQKYEAGDTVVYTIKTRNTVSDGKLENLVISDELPAGLSYVEGSLKASDGGKATIQDGKITADFGDVTDTEWRTVTFQAKIESGYADKTIKNVATVDGGNSDKPDKPGTDVKVDLKDPKLESKKTADIKEKAEGNKDAAHPEVGDTLLYTIQTRNTIEDSLVKNLVISDELPAGLEYVPGTLKVDDTAVSDDQDDDHGYYADGKASGDIGNVTDTKWHSVTFEVKVKSGQAGKDIVNTANISSDNINTPDKPSHEVKVYPRDPVLESEKTAKNLDTDKKKYEVGDTVVYTIKTRNTVSDSKIENLVISDELPAGLKYVEGSLKASNDGKATIKDGKITADFGDVTDTEWRTVTFQAKIKSGYAEKTIKNVATVDGGNVDKPDKPGTDIKVDLKDPKLESKKTASLKEKAKGNKDADHPEVGDTLLYTIQTRNTIEDSLVKNLVVSDSLPEGLEYVSGTLKVDGKAVSDDQDDDQGYYADGKASGDFGNVTDTKWHSVTFEVKVKSGQAGKDIVNTANVSSDNIKTPDKPSHEVKVYPRNPVLESEKTAKNLDKDKKKYEAGDTIVYTIKTRNTVSDGKVENLVISDKIPAGLKYVEGSLKASNGGKATIKDGEVTANFGDVTDTEWRTVTFQAKIESGYTGKTIKNVATVNGGNIEKPDKPEADVKIEQKDSEKPQQPGKSSKPHHPDKTGNPAKSNETKPDSGNELPNTATNTYNLILVGLVLVAAGTALWYFRRKRNA
ncbi:isopeptide-forming domain-containing fimbrial protein [Bacillus amyloliquefaciens]|uniref:isopeptide-forming domain-containing fimbrial protein n=1 Tax=Bacillus amyloliquefaciens TaxID=1390 RepID=UPI003C78A032